MENKQRLDKWLWCVRLFKTRTLATHACSEGRIKINGSSVKPSRNVSIGEIVFISREGIKRSYKVLELLERRVSAEIAANYVLEITPPNELEKLELKLKSAFHRPKGEGRPTKKERRQLDNLTMRQ